MDRSVGASRTNRKTSRGTRRLHHSLVDTLIARPYNSSSMRWLAAISLPCADKASVAETRLFIDTHASSRVHVYANAFDGHLALCKAVLTAMPARVRDNSGSAITLGAGRQLQGGGSSERRQERSSSGANSMKTNGSTSSAARHHPHFVTVTGVPGRTLHHERSRTQSVLTRSERVFLSPGLSLHRPMSFLSFSLRSRRQDHLLEAGTHPRRHLEVRHRLASGLRRASVATSFLAHKCRALARCDWRLHHAAVRGRSHRRRPSWPRSAHALSALRRVCGARGSLHRADDAHLPARRLLFTVAHAPVHS